MREPAKKGPKPKHKDPGQFNVTGEKTEIEASMKKAKEMKRPLSEVIMSLLAKWRKGEIDA